MQLLQEQSEDSNPVEIKYFEWTTFDIIGDLVFGQDFGSLRNRAHNDKFRLVLYTVAAISFLGSLQYFGLGFVVKILTTFGGAIESHDAVLRDIGTRLEKRMASAIKRPDLIEGLLKIPEEELGFLKLSSNSMLLAVAGSETTGTLLSGATYLLLRNTDKSYKLQREIRGRFGEGD